LSLGRAEKVATVLIGILSIIVAASIFSFLAQSPANSLETLIRIAAAKCPGLPGGSGGPGPDYINITIDVALVALFGIFVELTIKDMRRRRKRI
jgi:hypothetical protein